MSDPREEEEGAPRGVPLLAWPALVVALLGGIWAYGELRDDRATVVAASADLPAYHRLAAGDLETVEVDAPAPEGTFANKAKLLGAVTRKALGRDAKLVKGDVTKVVAPNALRGARLRLRPRRSTTIDVEPGDRVVLRLAPTTDDPEIAPASIPALLLDSNDRQGAGGELVVVVEAQLANSLLRLVGRADLLVTARRPS